MVRIATHLSKAKFSSSRKAVRKEKKCFFPGRSRCFFNPFQPAPRRQTARKYCLAYFLLFYHSDTTNIFFRIKNFFLYPMATCCHLATSGRNGSNSLTNFFSISIIKMHYSVPLRLLKTLKHEKNDSNIDRVPSRNFFKI